MSISTRNKTIQATNFGNIEQDDAHFGKRDSNKNKNV